MATPIKNPFYYLLLATCFCLLVTLFVYLIGWFYVPHAGRATPLVPMAPWMRWIDRNALYLLAGEIAALIVLAGLTIGMDRFFEPTTNLRREMQDNPTTTGDDKLA